MNTDTISLSDLEYFLVAAKAGSMTAAAKHFDVTPATVGRRIDQLQESVGISLMRRGRDGITLTRAGEHILDASKPVSKEIFKLRQLMSSLKDGGRITPVRVSATEPIIADFLAPALPALLELDSSIRIELISSTEVASLDRDEADLAIRMFRPQGDSLITRRLVNLEMGCFASNEYLANHTKESQELSDQPLLVMSEKYGRIPEVRWVVEQGLQNSVVMSCNSTRALIEAAKSGAGIAIAATHIAQKNKLVQVSSPPIPKRQLWLVYHRESRNSKSINMVKNWVTATISAAGGQMAS